MKQENNLQTLSDILEKNYNNTIFNPQLNKIFGKHLDAISNYIKPDREFWFYDGEKMCYRKLKITYVRSGVMFFTFTDEPKTEHAWFIGSFNTQSLYAAQIYPYEIANLLSKYYPDSLDDFPNICKQCKWDDCNSNITVDVIWK